MSLTIPIETSARHIHITEEDFQTLFGPGAKPTFAKELSQPGQYACKERLTVAGPKGRFEKVVILGPYRNETQVEISVTDARRLGIRSVIRQSGDLEGTPGCLLIGPKGKVELQRGVIVAKRHIHMTPVDALRAHVKDNDIVFVITIPPASSSSCSTDTPTAFRPGRKSFSTEYTGKKDRIINKNRR